MEIIAKKGDILATEAELVVVGMFEGEDIQNDFLSRVNDAVHGKLKKLSKMQNFEGKVGQHLIFPAPADVPAEFIMITGAGVENDASLETVRAIAGLAVSTAQKLGTKTLAMEFIGEDNQAFDAKSTASAITEASLMTDYQFNIYKKKKKEFVISSFTIVAEDGRDARKADKAIEQSYAVYEGVKLARDLVNTPGKDMTPHVLAFKAEEIAKTSGGRIKVKVLDREQCERKKMGAYLSVADGAEEEPLFIHLTYKPEKPTKKVIALVGKGVTFDSGGLSIKPAKFMETMKCDMAGAASVLGAFATFAVLQPSVEIHGIIPATENMPSGKSTRPGDIVKASNGKTIEVLNTDAEGRLTLADALVYAGKLEPNFIIDLATLTGACVVALGEEIAGVMSNNEQLTEKILSASKLTGEKIWELPLEQSYRKLLESDIADLRNISTVGYGTALTASLFLKEFIPEDAKWAHIDIAGPAFVTRPMASYIKKGGTGFGVRTLIQFIKSL